MSEVVWQAHDVSISLGGAQILHEVSLDVRAGEVVALLGPNGAGKSTLLSVLAGDLAPDAGSVTLFGSDVHGRPAAELARQRAVMLQAQTLAFGFTVREVVTMGRAPWLRDALDDDTIVNAALADADLSTLAERSFPTLSGGEKARAAFARLLAQTTPAVLLDEPTAALDLRHQEAVLAVARRIAADGAAVVVVLHDLTLAAAWADRLVVLSQGRIRAEGPPVQVLTPEVIGEVYGLPVDVLDHHGALVVVPIRGAR